MTPADGAPAARRVEGSTPSPGSLFMPGKRGVEHAYHLSRSSIAGKEPLPPTPSPRRRGGETSAPPLRFGEGVGGRGSFIPAQPLTVPSMRTEDDWLLTAARTAIHRPTATAILSDLHLGYAEARRRNGEAV